MSGPIHDNSKWFRCLVICITVMTCTTVICSTHYLVTISELAIEQGLIQTVIDGHVIWTNK